MLLKAAAIGDQTQNLGDQISQNGDLGRLKGDIAAVAHDLRADLDQLSITAWRGMRRNREAGEQGPQHGIRRHDAIGHNSSSHLVKLRGNGRLIPAQTKNGLGADHPDSRVRIGNQGSGAFPAAVKGRFSHQGDG